MDANTDTIVAVSTAIGRSAIAVVRLSGADAHTLAKRCLSRWPSMPRTAVLAEVRDPDSGAAIEQAVVTRYDAPHSFTGEDLVELSGHGGTLSPAAVTALLVKQGARLAEAGEFSRRAVLNGKLDLLEAEGIASVVDARTEAARRSALRHMDGGLIRPPSAQQSPVPPKPPPRRSGTPADDRSAKPPRTWGHRPHQSAPGPATS
jgi:tRNA modification GTPase